MANAKMRGRFKAVLLSTGLKYSFGMNSCNFMRIPSRSSGEHESVIDRNGEEELVFNSH
jgi:hypothetical protein